MLAKEVASLQYLSKNRFTLGVGVGWNPIEFESVQVPRTERGKRTDEIIEIVQRLLSQPSASYNGRYYQFPEISIEPLPEKPVPIWVGGGSQPAVEGASEPREHVAESVIQRIARSDGWYSSGNNPPRLMKSDWDRIQAAARDLGRDPSEITFAHSTSYHIVDTDDREKAYEEQQRVFGAYVGQQRPWSFVENAYLVGSISDIVNKIRERAELGVTFFRVGPVTSDPKELLRQIDLMATKVIPQLD